MKKIAVIFADGTEEIEALTVVDVLRRANAICDIVSVSGEYTTGSHGIVVKADKVIEKTDLDNYDALIIPGGMPGAVNIANTAKVTECLKRFMGGGKLIAAICAAPAVVLGDKNIIANKNVTCFYTPQFVEMLKNCRYTGKNVEIDGNLITANGPRAAMEFALQVAEHLNLTPKI